MIHSMTGYAAATGESARGALSLELRSVNSRYLDVQMRIGDELRALEPLLRELIGSRIARGKVECRLAFAPSAASGAQRLDAAALVRLRSLAQEAKNAFPDAAALRIADVLRWPGVVAEAQTDEGEMRALAERLCRKALDELNASRAREGAKLGAAVRERVMAMRRRVEEIAPLLPQALAAYQAKLTDKLREAIGSADDERIRAEIAVYATKIDVDEEITRLRAHLDEVLRTLDAKGPAGKRLDFLAQELNREANTLASKAASAALSDCALELKLLVEQLREQVQNIE